MVTSCSMSCSQRLHTGGYTNIPGIWDDGQIARWKSIRFSLLYIILCTTFFQSILGSFALSVRSTRKNGTFILYPTPGPRGCGRRRGPTKSGEYSVIGPRDMAPEGHETLRALIAEGIKKYMQPRATAAANAVRAGFDGL